MHTITSVRRSGERAKRRQHDNDKSTSIQHRQHRLLFVLAAGISFWSLVRLNVQELPIRELSGMVRHM